MTSVTIKTGLSTGILGAVAVIPYAVYTNSYSPVTATLPTPSFSATTASTVVTITMSSLSLTASLSVNSESNLKFEYDSR